MPPPCFTTTLSLDPACAAIITEIHQTFRPKDTGVCILSSGACSRSGDHQRALVSRNNLIWKGRKCCFHHLFISNKWTDNSVNPATEWRFVCFLPAKCLGRPFVTSSLSHVWRTYLLERKYLSFLSWGDERQRWQKKKTTLIVRRFLGSISQVFMV